LRKVISLPSLREGSQQLPDITTTLMMKELSKVLVQKQKQLLNFSTKRPMQRQQLRKRATKNKISKFTFMMHMKMKFKSKRMQT